MSRVTYPGILVFHMAPWLVRSQIWTGRNLAKLLCCGCFLCSTSGFPAKENEKRNNIPTQFHTYERQPGVKETGYWLKHRMVGILTDELRSGPSERPSNLSKQLLYLCKSKELSVFMLWTIGLLNDGKCTFMHKEVIKLVSLMKTVGFHISAKMDLKII